MNASTTPSLEMFRYEQERVEEICRTPDRADEEHYIQVNTPASLYGIGSILRRYANLPAEMPAPFSVEHFISYSPDSPVKFDMDAGYRTILTTTRERARAYKAAGMPQAISVGFALHYAIRLYERQYGPMPLEEARRGTLIFPHKSAAVLKERHFDHGPFIQWLLSLPAEYHPLYICIYWKDQQKGDARVFEEAGLPVVSCGHWLHDDFFLRFVDLCSRFRFSCANGFGTSFPLSVLCGCQFFYRDSNGFTEIEGGETTRRDTDPLRDSAIAQAALPLCRFPPVADDRIRQLNLARTLSGFGDVRSAGWMRRLFNKEIRYLSGTRANGVAFEGASPAWRDLRPWHPEGIELDGWLHSTTSLLLAPRRRAARLIMELEFPGWSGLAGQTINLSPPTGELRTFEIRPGRHQLIVPLQPTRESSRIKLRFHERFPLPGEERTACCRLSRFWVERGGCAPEQISMIPRSSA